MGMGTMEDEGMHACMYVSGWVTSTMVVHSTSLKEGLMNTCTHTYIHTNIAYSHHIQGGVVP
jgi:hypothetical protein